MTIKAYTRMNILQIYKDTVLTHEFDNNVHVSFMGDNSTIIIHDPRKINKVTIEMGSNCTMAIGRNLIVDGEMVIHAKADNSTITIGSNFHCGILDVFCIDESGLSLSIGDDCLFGWPVSIRLSDGHTIFDVHSRKALNIPHGVVIGDHVWIGRDVTLLKNAVISNDSIIGMKSLVTKPFSESNCVIAGVPARVIRKGVNWCFPHTDKYRA